METETKNLIFGTIIIIFGVSLVPVISHAISSTNGSLVVGSGLHDLSWIGYLIGLAFCISLIGIGLSVLYYKVYNS